MHRGTISSRFKKYKNLLRYQGIVFTIIYLKKEFSKRIKKIKGIVIKNKISFISPDETAINLLERADIYSRKLAEEHSIYKKQIKVHDLPEIYHYWSQKFIKPIFREYGFETIDKFFSNNLFESVKRTGSVAPRFVSIGAGNCDLEVAIVKSLLDMGLSDFIFECIELNDAMIERGRLQAKEAGVYDLMVFTQIDFNKWVPTSIYDGIMANQALHHVSELEYLFIQVYTSLHEKGAFVVSDMIGRNGHLRWPESLEIVQNFWKELPDRYKYNVLLNRLEDNYENWDCSKEGFEGIRAQDILPLLIKKFNFEIFIGFGNAIDVFVDRCFGHNFSINDIWDKDFIDRVHLADEDGLLNGNLTPTHMIAVMVKYKVESGMYSRGLSPMQCIRNITI